MALNALTGLRRAWTPQDDIDAVNARNADVDPAQYNQTLLNQVDAENPSVGALSPQWARYFKLLDAKGAGLAAAKPNPLPHGIASDPNSSFNDNEYFPNPGLAALKKLVGG